MSLADAKYLLLTTFRKDGTPVPTPLWVVGEADTLFVWTPVDSGKVKRIRRAGDVEVAPCDLRGNPTGTAVKAQARLLDETGSDRVRHLIGRKYGLFGKVTVFGSKLRRGKNGTVGIAIVPST
ncbi:MULTISPECIES: PPOX class F420-dependent oxidoreductase [unclassified Saccharothrix]|uniref:PPOX class F420-dependent oxidoreductase n=1 Tax=unclassified Saccharothrix TaxID=2593673 RepID=UPI00307F1953